MTCFGHNIESFVCRMMGVTVDVRSAYGGHIDCSDCIRGLLFNIVMCCLHVVSL